jgi:glucan phosphoethanolaminetransferase (alkaline phosphatase superfamily)
MTTTKNITKEAYAWGHFGVILFHLIIACLLTFNKIIFKNEYRLRKWFQWIGIILLIVSLLALVPIFMYYNKNYQYLINMN